MAAISKMILSGCTNGRMIKVTQTATAGDLVHTAVAGTGADNMDEIWLWAVNSDTTARKLTIEFGGVAAPDDLVEMTIPAESGPVLVLPGFVLQNGLVVRAFCASANVVMVGGYVNRVS